ncbi:hypothetical protein BGW38_006703 [Lunasporangiospora selenospora]|uniref:Copper transport protein n=1 Tax=Lunasporangiospora selenospora TaxID=979761 RepID=A0A9P6G040_9FUNG|nr:hypothetical protein BGW38_006703 [Lunasporangiospora selenospora]
MDHGGGGHGGDGGDGGHGDHGGGGTCSMNMLFNWSTENLCVRLMDGDRKRGESMASGSQTSDDTPLLNNRQHTVKLTNRQQLTRSLLYMVQVFMGFFLMLIFMTYNGYLMISTAVGAGLGFFYFGADTLSPASKALSCH